MKQKPYHSHRMSAPQDGSGASISTGSGSRAFGLLILYHVGMLYVSWGFHIKSAHRITALEPLMLVLNPWRLALLFLVSGVATRFMLRKYAVGPLLRSRSVAAA